MNRSIVFAMRRGEECFEISSSLCSFCFANGGRGPTFKPKLHMSSFYFAAMQLCPYSTPTAQGRGMGRRGKRGKGERRKQEGGETVLLLIRTSDDVTVPVAREWHNDTLETWISVAHVESRD